MKQRTDLTNNRVADKSKINFYLSNHWIDINQFVLVCLNEEYELRYLY